MGRANVNTTSREIVNTKKWCCVIAGVCDCRRPAGQLLLPPAGGGGGGGWGDWIYMSGCTLTLPNCPTILICTARTCQLAQSATREMVTSSYPVPDPFCSGISAACLRNNSAPYYFGPSESSSFLEDLHGNYTYFKRQTLLILAGPLLSQCPHYLPSF